MGFGPSVASVIQTCAAENDPSALSGRPDLHALANEKREANQSSTWAALRLRWKSNCHTSEHFMIDQL